MAGGKRSPAKRSGARGLRRPGPSRARRPEPQQTPRRRPLAVRLAVVAVAVLLAWVLVIRAPGPGEIDAAALAAAEAAGCADLERPVVADPSREHLAPGDAYAYEDPPAAAGPHDPSPLPADPHVYAGPVSEPRSVHNLEHAYVVVRYAPPSEAGGVRGAQEASADARAVAPPREGLSAETVTALEDLARGQDRVIIAPYPGLPADRALVLLAWNTRWRCPGTVTPDRAVAIATAFIEAYRGTTNAPEAPRGLLGRVLTD